MGIISGLLDHAVDNLVEGGFAFANCLANHRAQGERVRARLHESCPMGGVLNAVGKDQRLLLDLVQAPRSEESRNGHRQHRGDGRTKKADGVLAHTRRAGVGLGKVFSVIADVGEHWDDPALTNLCFVGRFLLAQRSR